MVKRLLLIGACLFAAAANAEMSQEQIRERLLQLFPEHQPDQIRPAPISGMYEVLYGGEVMYISTDGKHLIQSGELYDLDHKRNLTEAARAQARAKILDNFGTARMLVFPATGVTRHAITVVTDIDCPYCRQFHAQIEEYTSEGVEVRYLLYPRAGVDSESYRKSVSVWCAEDQRDALTRAKRLEPVPDKSCANPVMEHIELVDEISIRSTPSIFLPDGTLLRGYRPAMEILAELDG